MVCWWLLTDIALRDVSRADDRFSLRVVPRLKQLRVTPASVVINYGKILYGFKIIYLMII